MRYVLASEMNPTHGCFGASSALQPSPPDSFSFHRMLFIAVCSRRLGFLCQKDIKIWVKLCNFRENCGTDLFIGYKMAKTTAVLGPHWSELVETRKRSLVNVLKVLCGGLNYPGVVPLGFQLRDLLLLLQQLLPAGV